MSKLYLRVPNFPGKEKLMAKAAVIAAKISQKSPELCIAGAVAFGITGTVLACRATLKVSDVLVKYEDKMLDIKNGEELQAAGKLSPENQYPPEMARRDKLLTVLHFGVDLGRLYFPAILCGGISIGFIFGSYKIMMQRNVTLLLAYESLQKVYDNYRQRVRDEVGEEKELDIYKGVRNTTFTDENGKKKKAHELVGAASMYTRIFDESNRFWRSDNEINKFFLVCQQSHANDLLRIRGFIFLNEVLEMIGMPPCPMGQDVGWLANGNGDGFVSFGMWDATKEAKREFINGYEKSIWLDFNCDGYIKDKI